MPKINKKDVRESIEKILDTGILQKSKSLVKVALF